MRPELLENVRDFILKHNMIAPGQKVLAALSGGADSVCMLHILLRLSKEMGFTIACAHLNHRLRGAEAERDARFCGELCEEAGVEFIPGECDVAALAAKEGLSTEEAGRRARYAFLHRVKKETGAQVIATAHNKNDLAESVLLHIIRGSGLEGLRGIRPVRADGVVRPMLGVERRQIEQYCSEHGLKYVTDSTNFSAAYARNRVRSLLLPLIMREFNPNIVNTLSNLSVTAGEDADYIASQAEGCRSLLEHDGDCCYVELGALGTLHPAISRRLFMRMAEESGASLTFENSQAILRLSAAGKTGKELHMGGAVFGVSYGRLFARPQKPPAAQYEYPLIIGQTVEIPAAGCSFTAAVAPAGKGAPFKQYFDLSVLDGGLCVRNRRDGDVIAIECGTKKLKDLFIDCKVPRHERAVMPLVALGNRILWIPGLRRSAQMRPKVGGKALEITFLKGVPDNAK